MEETRTTTSDMGYKPPSVFLFSHPMLSHPFCLYKFGEQEGHTIHTTNSTLVPRDTCLSCFLLEEDSDNPFRSDFSLKVFFSSFSPLVRTKILLYLIYSPFFRKFVPFFLSSYLFSTPPLPRDIICASSCPCESVRWVRVGGRTPSFRVMTGFLDYDLVTTEHLSPYRFRKSLDPDQGGDGCRESETRVGPQ